ncbi:LysR family transcriptional regulator [Nitrospirillum amazonense]|uniref:LysR family transcriptional regulator n=1 Tax=Nitrospirillum amazonense TaxID=28077 RepID=A0A560JED8_9PROT|nr:LysR family transcriptional regulator [Nitrospirillum amazonense]MDG3438860.1 LysR family transcriptional regulator [Nitrospirillum amazonense]TWB69337.1 LysR family transcriptional regulator [Nitrospirillum amazonense]
MTDLTLRELAALAAVAEHRSFRAAAAAIGASPSSLSHRVAAMERQLGVRLFNRTTRSVALTEAGEHFLARVMPATREIADAVETVNRFRDTPAGLLRLNTSEEAAARMLPLILDFMARYPDMRVDLVAEGRMIDIVASGFDAGFRAADTVPEDMVAIPLGEEEGWAVVATPAYFQTHGLPRVPADLLRHDCIRARLPSGTIYRWEFAPHGGPARGGPMGDGEIRIDVPGRLTLGSHALCLNAARAGAGIAYVSLRDVAADLAAGRLARALADWTPPSPGLALYYPRQRLPSAGLKAFIDHTKAWRAGGRGYA